MSPPARWRSPEELLRVGLQRSRLVLVNEAHNGLRRAPRTRQIGIRLITEAHRWGVRHLALEALQPRELAEQVNRTGRLPERGGYLGQPEMRDLVASALDRGWTLVSYEADMSAKPAGLAPLSTAETNWREQQQARNLAAALRALPRKASLLVWCGNGHLNKLGLDEWVPMGARLQSTTGVEPFALDQITTIALHPDHLPAGRRWQLAFRVELEALGGTGGFLSEDAPPDWVQRGADAYLLSNDNTLI